MKRELKSMARIWSLMFVMGFAFIFLMNLSSAEYLPLKQNQSFSFTITSDNATQCNVTAIDYPNGTISLIQAMTQSGHTFNSTIAGGNFSILGTYCIKIVCTDGVRFEPGSVCREVTENGEQFDINQSISLIGLAVLLALFFSIGLAFKEKWKLRTFFFMAALIMGIILLNSVRIIIGSSSSLASMGSTGLTLGIIVLAFMFLYLLIYSTIEVFNYFKEKKKMRWEVGNEPY